MTMIKLSETDLKLAELVRRVEEGEEIVIARGDVPVVVLQRCATSEPDGAEIEKRRRSAYGALAGKLSADWDKALFEPMSEEELSLWYDGPIFPDER